MAVGRQDGLGCVVQVKNGDSGGAVKNGDSGGAVKNGDSGGALDSLPLPPSLPLPLSPSPSGSLKGRVRCCAYEVVWMHAQLAFMNDE
jgi:hypothetical protein